MIGFKHRYPDGSESSLGMDANDLIEIIKEIRLSKIKDLISKRKRRNNNKIVIIVAISKREEDSYLVDELPKQIDNYLNSRSLVGAFEIHKLTEDESKNVSNSNWQETLRKYKGHLIIYGRVVKGNKDSQEVYSLMLEGGVQHNPIPNIISNSLSYEFATIFPRERFIPNSENLLGFNIAAESIGLAVEYMVAVAFFISGNLGFSFSVLTDLNEKILNSKEDSQSISLLKSKAAQRLSEVSLSIAFLLYDIYINTRNEQHVIDAKVYLDVVSKLNPNDKRGKTLDSIYYYLVGNIDESIKMMKLADDPIQHFNLGFLYLVKDDISNGIRHYRKGFKNISLLPKIYFDLELFITDAIKKHPSKPQLIYARALINYRAKEDYILAKKDFKEFLEQSEDKKNLEEPRRLSEIYLEELNRKQL